MFLEFMHRMHVSCFNTEKREKCVFTVLECWYWFRLCFAGLVPFVFLLLIVGCSARALYPLPSRRNDRNRQPLQTFRAYNIAHRGSNGEIPEETTAAYLVWIFSVIRKYFISSKYLMLPSILLLQDFILTRIINTAKCVTWNSSMLCCIHDIDLEWLSNVFFLN